jgi:dTDP-4-dehydrorhamnose reductase
MLNVLVTGCNGQLGRHVRLLTSASQHNYQFTDVDTLDITKRDAVMNYVLTNNINVVINCAAYTNVDKAEEEEDVAEAINATAVRHLADAMKVNNGTLVHVSTDYVFGGAAYNRPIREDDAMNPTGAYGRTKMHGEEAIFEVGCNYLIFRTGWLYSEYGKNFLLTMMRLFSEGKACKVVYDQVGTPTYAGDLARVIVDVVENEDFQGTNGVFHYSGEGVCSWFDFAKEIARQTQLTDSRIAPCLSSEYPSRVVRPPYSVLCKSKIKQTLGVTIPYWVDALSVCLGNINQKQNEPS